MSRITLFKKFGYKRALRDGPGVTERCGSVKDCCYILKERS